MPFKVSARTLLQLGAELISSDEIAFYELIKNAFDARSKRVEISVVSRVPYDVLNELRGLLNREKDKGTLLDKQFINIFHKRLIEAISSNYPAETHFAQRVLDSNTYDVLEKILDEANYIIVRDTGEGMSYDDLERVYLTVGTPSRYIQKQKNFFDLIDKQEKDADPILGEKGVGRLSVMRLGNKLRVTSTRKGEKRWNVLDVDWSLFSNVEKFIGDIDIGPEYGDFKNDKSVSGTTLYITSLTGEWSREKLEKIALDEFSKLTDPFVPSLRYPLVLKFNDEAINIGHLDKMIFEWAHAIVNAEYSIDKLGEPQLVYNIDYVLRKRKKAGIIQGTHLISVAQTSSLSTLRSLGPFKVKFYWYNRRIINAVEGIGDQKRVRELVARWAGGLMLYRDGFRVNPYGGLNDDWLGIDEKALASPGYKVNRRQIIGKVDISARGNPTLIDQTNREGLRYSDEKQVLKNLLLFLVLELRNFLNQVDDEVQAREPVTFESIDERVETQEKRIKDNLQALLIKYPQLKSDTEIFPIITDATKKIRGWMDEAKNLAESYEKGRTQIVHLAGLGLMVEILAHELNRATSHTLSTLTEQGNANVLPQDVKSLFTTLESQLKTLQKRLKILDPLSTSGRQVKEIFDLLEWVNQILDSHKAQFHRHGINYMVQLEPLQSNNKMQIHAVKGMIVQILENLISNSVYWLKQEKVINKNFKPQIIIKINSEKKEIFFTDNGPGIDPRMKEDIFQPFVTTKPPGEGKGLGLFISREIATYNGAVLYLSDQSTVHDGVLNTFVFAIGGDKK